MGGSLTPLLQLRLHAVRLEAEGILSFELRAADGGELPAFTAGAHVDVHLPGALVRSYSLANAQHERNRYVIAVDHAADGRGGSRWMHESLRVGATLAVSFPRNLFPLVETAPHSVLVAGGVGVTPLWSMAQQLAQSGASWELHYAVRSRDRAAYANEAAKLAAACGAAFHLYCSNADLPRRMDIAAVVAAAPQGSHLYCCGPARMIEQFQGATSGLPEDRVHVEHFAPVQEAAVAGGFQVRLARSQRCVPVPEGSTILDALLKAGVAVPNSCLAGTCGMCETAVISGVPDHRDVILTAAERKANRTMMLCCSGSLSPELVLDA